MKGYRANMASSAISWDAVSVSYMFLKKWNKSFLVLSDPWDELPLQVTSARKEHHPVLAETMERIVTLMSRRAL